MQTPGYRPDCNAVSCRSVAIPNTMKDCFGLYIGVLNTEMSLIQGFTASQRFHELGFISIENRNIFIVTVKQISSFLLTSGFH